MRKAIALAIILVINVICAIQECHAQQESAIAGRMQRKGRYLLLDGQLQTDEQLSALLGEEGFATYEKARKRFVAGQSTLITGYAALGMVVGVAAVVNMVPYDGCVPSGMQYLGMLFAEANFIAALALIPTGATLKIVGRRRLNSLADEYNAAHNAPNLQVGPAVMSALGPDAARLVLGVNVVLSF